MNDLNFRDITVFASSDIADTEVSFINTIIGSRRIVSLINDMTSDERRVIEVTNRLLGNPDSYFTLERLQQAFDAAEAVEHVTHIVLSYATRRVYIALLIDEERNLIGLLDDGTHRNTYLGIPR
jgi:hypothetical protein